MKVIFDANSLLGQKSGVGYLTLSLIEAMAKNHPNDIVLVGHYFNFLNKKDESLLPRAKNISYKKTIYFPTKLINIFRRVGIELPLELFFRERADVYLYTNFVSFPSLRKSKQILFVHDLSFIDTPQFASSANAVFLKKFVPKSIKRSNTIITISEFSKQRIVEVYNPNKAIEVMPVPAQISTRVDEGVLKDHDIPKKFILFVGTIEPRKNLSVLLDAYIKIHKQTRTALVLVGAKGWKDTEIANKISSLKSSGLPIILTGYVSDAEKAALFSTATIYIQPSLYEGFGMPILEAMSLGCPVLCSDISVFHEVAGDAAEYFNPHSKAELAKKVVNVLNDKHRREIMISKSNARSKGYPIWEDVAKQIFSVIESM